MAQNRYLWGILGGVFTILFYLVIYNLDKELFVSTSIYYAGLIPMIISMIIGILYIKSQSVELFDFKDIISIAFAIYVIADIIYWIFYFVMVEYIDPSIITLQKQLAVEHAIANYGKGHTEVERVSNADFSLQFRYLLYSIAQGMVGGFIISAILALIFRDK